MHKRVKVCVRARPTTATNGSSGGQSGVLLNPQEQVREELSVC